MFYHEVWPSHGVEKECNHCGAFQSENIFDTKHEENCPVALIEEGLEDIKRIEL